MNEISLIIFSTFYLSSNFLKKGEPGPPGPPGKAYIPILDYKNYGHHHEHAHPPKKSGYKSEEYDSRSDEDYYNDWDNDSGYKGYKRSNRYGERAKLLSGKRPKRSHAPKKSARGQEKQEYGKPEILGKILETEARNRRGTLKKNQFASSVFFNMVA